MSDGIKNYAFTKGKKKRKENSHFTKLTELFFCVCI